MKKVEDCFVEYVIFSDLHGNSYALNELLKKEYHGLEKTFIFCGDVCGYYYHSIECIKMLESINPLIVVRGNHDQYYLDAYDNNELTETLVKKYGVSYRDKSLYIINYLKKMPVSLEMNIGEKRVYIQHGSIENSLEGRIYPDSELEELDDAIYFAGHTHYQMFKQVGKTIWVNPGSLGQPRDGNGFSYCVIDDQTLNVSFKTVKIDIAPLLKEIRRLDPDNRYLEEVLYRNK